MFCCAVRAFPCAAKGLVVYFFDAYVISLSSDHNVINYYLKVKHLHGFLFFAL